MHFRKIRTSQVKKVNQRHRPEEENSETEFHLKAFAGPMNLSCILRVFQSLEARWGKAKSRVCLKYRM